MKRFIRAVLIVGSIATTGCASVGSMLNPFAESPKPVALLGEANDHAISGTKKSEDGARAALEAMSTYDRAHMPQPVNPVMQPAVVRLMWVPDHLNKNGDLVPAHYYYLKVLRDRWAVQDAFELEGQLNGPGGNSDVSNLPYVFGDGK